MENNKSALFTLVNDSITKILKAKLKSKAGYVKAEESSNVEWLFEALEDVMVNFEDVKPKVLAMDDQLERIMKLRQGSTSNEDFIKLIQKELKLFEKHGGSFLWGKTQEEQLCSNNGSNQWTSAYRRRAYQKT